MTQYDLLASMQRYWMLQRVYRLLQAYERWIERSFMRMCLIILGLTFAMFTIYGVG